MKTIQPELNFNLKNFNTYKLPSVADIVYIPNTIEELIDLLENLDNFIILGAGSNVILSATGIKTPMVLTHKLNNIEIAEGVVSVECGVKSAYLSKITAENSLSGFEFLAPIPSFMGGAIYMNASAHGQAISDVFLEACVYDVIAKKVLTLNKEDMQFAYRKSILQEKRYILLNAKFALVQKEKSEILEKINDNISKRQKTQPSLKTPNAGSIFKNPEGSSAGALIEQAGLKGKTVGGAQISELHANFIVNLGTAQSSDILELMFFAYNEVEKKFNIKLKPEVIFVGEKTEAEDKIWQKLQN